MPRTATRYAHLDWARGVAVLIMIMAHALDAWTRVPDRTSNLFGYLMLIGGFAAPLFLWLAGFGLALSGEQAVVRGRTRRSTMEVIVARGAEIFILAFLFRLQAFIVSPGSAPVTLFRVDILNVMGPAIAAAGIVWGVSGGPRRAAAACAAAATLLAMLTPVIRHAGWVGALPTWFQWYLRPSGEHTTFTLLPWAGFVVAGAASGALFGAARVPVDRRFWAALGLAGLAAVGVGAYASLLPSIYASSSFWTSSPTYFAIRVGLMMTTLSVLAALAPVAAALGPGAFGWLEKFGRNSLFIYWIHVELVYGYATWGVHRRLPLWLAVVGYAVFCGLMLGAVAVRERVVTYWRIGRGADRAAASAASAPL